LPITIFKVNLKNREEFLFNLIVLKNANNENELLEEIQLISPVRPQFLFYSQNRSKELGDLEFSNWSFFLHLLFIFFFLIQEDSNDDVKVLEHDDVD
jgi:hypothetical protein